ncbi:MAG: oxidoreductase [Pseudomonadota bacterium]|jgi:thiol:disulfide interchange protein DsbA
MSEIDRATRRFLKTLAAGAVTLSAGPVLAQSKTPQEGFEYRAVSPQQQTDAPGRIEVLEFFWYGCPHCNALEPLLKEWVAKQPPDVLFRKVHVGLGPSWVAHQQLFYTIEAMGKSAEMHDRVFAAIHVDRNPLDKPDRMADFVAKFGLDRKLFLETFESFAVKTRMRKASTMAEAYRLDGVPAMAVNGRWFTSPSMAGGSAQSLRVLDALIDRERKALKR